ncbi:hypothetical protein ACIBCM_33325 [Streptomyces sp. NPDC051018]|uniref:hypothetical protein n=1 Tax=Streptomyces sp. NPDC051018 TaxID=3365639 RepID=UPI0037B1426F
MTQWTGFSAKSSIHPASDAPVGIAVKPAAGITGADGSPPQESSRYERARVASLAVQNAIRAARIPPVPVPDDAPAASATARTGGQDRAADLPHGVDHPGRDAVLIPGWRAAAVHAHQQTAMPQEYLEGRTTDPATWMRTPERLAHRR